MDKQFVEFWRNFFNKAAEGQKQMDDLAGWMRMGLKSMEEMASFFQKNCGLDQAAKGSAEYLEVWNKAQKDFQKSMRDLYGLMGVVPYEEHVSLVRKYEDLKEQAASQKETIRHLQILLSEERKQEHEEMTGKVQGLVNKQAEQFQTIMETFRQSFESMGAAAQRPAARKAKK